MGPNYRNTNKFVLGSQLQTFPQKNSNSLQLPGSKLQIQPTPQS